jgi:carbon-monoxide dehydrogenase large subunit
MNAPITPGLDTAGFAHIGQSLARKEDWRLLTGRARYLDDLQFVGALHAHFVRSPHAHARIVAVDASAALALPGVVSVVTGKELAQWTTHLRMAPPIDGLLPTEVATLPTQKVRFQGDLVACVVARDRYLAEDAAELVSVEYEPLPPVVSMDAALAPGAPLVDESLPTNRVSYQRFAKGDVPAAMRAWRTASSKRRSRNTGRRMCRSRRAAASRYGMRAGSTSPCTSHRKCLIPIALNSPRVCGSPRRR